MRVSILRFALALSLPVAAGVPAFAQDAYDDGQPPAAIALFTSENFYGDVREAFDPFVSMHDLAFNDRARSVAVLAGQWELCEHANFTGRCVFVREDVADLGWFDLNGRISSIRPIYEYTEAQHGLMFTRDDNGYIRYAHNEAYGYDTWNYGYSSSVRLSVQHYGYSPDYWRFGYYDPRWGYDPYGFAWRPYGGPRYVSYTYRVHPRPVVINTYWKKHWGRDHKHWDRRGHRDDWRHRPDWGGRGDDRGPGRGHGGWDRDRDRDHGRDGYRDRDRDGNRDRDWNRDRDRDRTDGRPGRGDGPRADRPDGPRPGVMPVDPRRGEDRPRGGPTPGRDIITLPSTETGRDGGWRGGDRRNGWGEDGQRERGRGEGRFGEGRSRPSSPDVSTPRAEIPVVAPPTVGSRPDRVRPDRERGGGEGRDRGGDRGGDRLLGAPGGGREGGWRGGGDGGRRGGGDSARVATPAPIASPPAVRPSSPPTAVARPAPEPRVERGPGRGSERSQRGERGGRGNTFEQ